MMLLFGITGFIWIEEAFVNISSTVNVKEDQFDNE